MHLFAEISGHGFGHLAISAPVLNALAAAEPGLRLTLRSSLPEAQLRTRLRPAFRLLPEASDFGFVMHDTLTVDVAASAAAYRAAHADWPARVAREAAFLGELAPDLVLSNVAYLPLAGAQVAGIPALALCCLNWADLFAHFFGDADWAAPIHADMLAAYRAATFLRITPGMPMPALPARREIGPIAALGRRHDLGLGGARAVLVAMGGIAHRVPIAAWPRLPGIRWLAPAAWLGEHPDGMASDRLGLAFTDLLCSVDAVLTKPGYGTFSEAACNGTPVLYQRRADWPEQDCLIDWLQAHAACREVSGETVASGDLAAALDALWAQPRPPRPPATGIAEALAAIRAAAGRSA